MELASINAQNHHDNNEEKVTNFNQDDEISNADKVDLDSGTENNLYLCEIDKII